MKKLYPLISALLLTALFLSACGGAGGDTNLTPGALGTEIPGGGLDLTGTPDGLEEPMGTPTLAVTDMVETTPTMAVEETAAPTDGVDTTGTPEAGVPVTGEVGCQPNRLTSLFEFNVVGDDGSVIGEVDAVVVYRDAAGAALSDDMGSSTETTPAATAGADEATPAATDAAGDDAGAVGDFVAGAVPQVAYLVVDLDDAGNLGDKDVLVPFSGFTAPVVADQDVADCDFTLAVDAAALEGAPNFDDDAWEEEDLTVPDWDADFNTYWTDQGLTVNTTDESGAELGNPVILSDTFDDIDVENANGDDLGEIEDFIIDSQTGAFRYAILAAGGFLGLGESHIPVPVERISWTERDDDPDDLGEATLNVPEDAWENVPVIEDLNGFDFNDEAWDAEFETYWTGLDGSTNE